MKKLLIVIIVVCLPLSLIGCVDYSSLDDAKAEQVLSENVEVQNAELLRSNFEEIQKLNEDIDLMKTENDQLIADNASLNDLLEQKDKNIEQAKQEVLETAKSKTDDMAIKDELFQFLFRDLDNLERSEFIYVDIDQIDYKSVSAHTITFDRVQLNRTNSSLRRKFDNKVVNLETLDVSSNVIIKNKYKDCLGLDEDSAHMLIDYIFIDDEIEVIESFAWYIDQRSDENDGKTHVLCIQNDEVVMIFER